MVVFSNLLMKNLDRNMVSNFCVECYIRILIFLKVFFFWLDKKDMRMVPRIKNEIKYTFINTILFFSF